MHKLTDVTGIIVSIFGVGALLAGLILTGQHGIKGEIHGMKVDIADLQQRTARIEGQLSLPDRSLEYRQTRFSHCCREVAVQRAGSGLRFPAQSRTPIDNIKVRHYLTLYENCHLIKRPDRHTGRLS